MTYLTYFRLLCGSSILVLLVAKLQVIVDKGPCQYGAVLQRLLTTWLGRGATARSESSPGARSRLSWALPSRSVVMAVLADGQKFALSSISKSQTNKSVLYVKLTDSALRSLEEYLKNKVSVLYQA